MSTTPEELNRINAELKKKIDLFTLEFAKEFVMRVKQKTPVITGKLRDGWLSEVKKDVIEVSNTVDYAPFVEFGTHKMSPRGMLRSTVEEADQVAEVARQKAGLE